MVKDSQETGKYWDASWNVWYGCESRGMGCKNCWARTVHEQRRLGSYGKSQRKKMYARPFDEVTIFTERLDIPLHWKQPRIVAVNFSGDPYSERVADEMLDKVVAVEALCPQHTFIHLTKRWERMAEYWNAPGDGPLGSYNAHDRIAHEANSIVYPQGVGIEWPLPNVQPGVSVSTQAELDAAASYLLATPAAVRVLSLEPLLEGMRLRSPSCRGRSYRTYDRIHGLGWVIVGCETGPNRRLCKLEWIESIVRQCQAADVPVWVKGVEINGHVSHDMSDWPKSIRCRELPK